MIQHWYASSTVGEWLKRSVSFLNLGVIILTLVIIVSEFRFDWCESLAGRYLMSTNDSRPEIGSIWETGRHTVNARQSLNQMILQRETLGRTARNADSFLDLTQGLGAGEWANLDKDRFRQLYLSLTPSHRHKLIEPARLIWLLNGSTTDRIFCEGRIGGVKIYFIDSGNRVIHQIDLENQALTSTTAEPFFQGALEDIPGFSGSVYPADMFFQAVFRLPPDMMPDLIHDAETLLTRTGTIGRVGVWNTAEEGFIQLGFEFNQLGETRVVLIKAREWAVWQLSLALKGEDQ